MSRVIEIRDLRIGEGIPKIIAPIVDNTHEMILKKAAVIKELPVDAVEWRADFYDDVTVMDRVVDTVKSLRKAMPEMPLLFTFRTGREGGAKDISMKMYTSLNKALAQSGAVDLIDVELFSGDSVVSENIANIHNAGVYALVSNHDFTGTPDKDELIRRMRKMQDMGADILKIAVMPESASDVLTLLSATHEMYSKYANKPIVTMAMSQRGVISRIAGEAFGSSMTFGAVGQVSAPGQIPVEKLSSILKILHNNNH